MRVRIRERMARAAVGDDLPVGLREGHLLREADHLLGRRHRVVVAVEREHLCGDRRLRAEVRRTEERMEADRGLHAARVRTREVERAEAAEAEADDREARRIGAVEFRRGIDRAEQARAQRAAVLDPRRHQLRVLLGRVAAAPLAVDIDREADVAERREHVGLRAREVVLTAPRMRDEHDRRARACGRRPREISLEFLLSVVIGEEAAACVGRAHAASLANQTAALSRSLHAAQASLKRWKVPRAKGLGTCFIAAASSSQDSGGIERVTASMSDASSVAQTSGRGSKSAHRGMLSS